ncbi:hypothetical protein L1887_32462 [Cichorium endivia]|nr:hypothetical protein L1887_32462 [Cichorium endivia]
MEVTEMEWRRETSLKLHLLSSSQFSTLSLIKIKREKQNSGENERNGLCCVDGDEAGRPISDLEVQGYFISSAIVIGIYVQDFDLIAIH